MGSSVKRFAGRVFLLQKGLWGGFLSARRFARWVSFCRKACVVGFFLQEGLPGGFLSAGRFAGWVSFCRNVCRVGLSLHEGSRGGFPHGKKGIFWGGFLHAGGIVGLILSRRRDCGMSFRANTGGTVKFVSSRRVALLTHLFMQERLWDWSP